MVAKSPFLSTKLIKQNIKGVLGKGGVCVNAVCGKSRAVQGGPDCKGLTIGKIQPSSPF